MTSRITHLIEEQHNISKLFKIENLDVEIGRTQEDSQNTEAPTPDKEELLLLNPRKESQQHEVTMPKGDKNHNGKRITEMKTKGKKVKKFSKKRENIERLHKVPEGTLQKEGLQDWNFIEISKQCNMVKKYSH